VSLVTGQTAPQTMTEGGQGTFASFDDGYSPGDPVDRAILATRRAVVPLHGLMP
jgi:acetoin utilization protein AcuC